METIGKQYKIITLSLLCLLGANVVELEAGGPRRGGHQQNRGFPRHHRDRLPGDAQTDQKDGDGAEEEDEDSGGRRGRRGPHGGFGRRMGPWMGMHGGRRGGPGEGDEGEHPGGPKRKGMLGGLPDKLSTIDQRLDGIDAQLKEITETLGALKAASTRTNKEKND